jgi:ribosomal-protein-alanine N-acetyltransferase
MRSHSKTLRAISSSSGGAYQCQQDVPSDNISPGVPSADAIHSVAGAVAAFNSDRPWHWEAVKSAPAVIETPRLRLREFTMGDAPLVVALLNDPGFLNNVGDRGVRTIADAEKYLTDRLLASYREYRFGLYVVELKESGEAVGTCGLVQRDYLDVPDIGFSVLGPHMRRGYTLEAAAAVLAWSRKTLHLTRIVAVTRASNIATHRLLEKLGLNYERPIELPGATVEWLLFG